MAYTSESILILRFIQRTMTAKQSCRMLCAVLSPKASQLTSMM